MSARRKEVQVTVVTYVPGGTRKDRIGIPASDWHSMDEDERGAYLDNVSAYIARKHGKGGPK